MNGCTATEIKTILLTIYYVGIGVSFILSVWRLFYLDAKINYFWLICIWSLSWPFAVLVCGLLCMLDYLKETVEQDKDLALRDAVKDGKDIALRSSAAEGRHRLES